MNKQLHKAIEEATNFVRFNPDYKNEMMRIFDDGKWILNEEKDISQAKLLRVIELLMEQRNDAYDSIVHNDMDAELIAALEGKP